MDIKPRHILLMAAKYEFMSQGIKTGSFVCFNLSKFKCKTEFDEEHDEHDNRNQKRITTVDRPFVCGACHKEFTQKCTLKTHKRAVHTGEKPYKCKTCRIGFTQKCQLEQHLRVHTGGNLYKCNDCIKGFTRKSKPGKTSAYSHW